MEYTLEGFKSLLEKHDWTYEQSDDHRVYLKGQKEWNAICCYKEALLLQGKSKEMLDNLICNYSFNTI